MKKQFIIGMLALLAVAFTFSSCGKYEEGPSISLLTKKMRLTGNWKLTKYQTNCTTNAPDGTDITSTVQSVWGSSCEWQIVKDGSYKITGNFAESGTWKFGEDKDDVTFTPSSGSSTTYRIVLLKNKELGLKYTNANGSWEKMYFAQ